MRQGRVTQVFSKNQSVKNVFIKKPAQSNQTTPKRLGALSLSLLMAFSQLHSIAHAQVVVAPNAPLQNQPHYAAPAGTNQVPVVNIVTPNGAGVSHNTYNQFNVTQQGLILNNSPTNTNTQLGGWIQGNPNLPYGGARIILNEVNSTNPSLLNGYIEIGGQRADLIIANPAGISIDGAGFINASGITLTTGVPQYNQWGGIEAYRVGGIAGGTGQITITGQGLDTSTTDYTQIIARAVQINSGIWANDLRITAGTGLVSPDAQPIQLIAQDSNGQPLYAIDVSQLGGMYAGKIRLIGTQSDLGVRNAGTIGASAGQIQITTDGRLINSGSIQSTAQQPQNASLQIAAAGNIQNLGTIYTTGNANIQTSQTLNNQGTLAAQQNLSIQAQITNNQKEATDPNKAGLIAAGMNSDGSLNTAGSLNINTIQVTNDGQLIAGNNLNIYAQQDVTNTGSLYSQNSTALQAQNITNQGRIAAQKDVTLNAQQNIANHNQSVISSGLNADGSLNAAGNLRMNAFELTNDGQLLAGNNLAIQAQQNIINQGQISAQKDINIQAQHIHNKNTASIIAGLSQASSQFNNSGSVTLQASQTLVNDGQLLAGKDATLYATTLNNQGQIQTGQNLTIAQTPGATAPANTITNSGILSAGSTQTILTQNLDNTKDGEILAQTGLNLQVDNTLTNRGLIDSTALLIQANHLNNIGTGRIYGNQLAIEAQQIDNHDETIGSQTDAAVIAAREQLNIGVQTLNNLNNALIYSAGDIAIGGALDTNQQATGNATLITNDGAIIEAAGSAPNSNGDITITTTDIKNLNSQFATRDIVIATQDKFTHEIPLMGWAWDNDDILYIREGAYGDYSYHSIGKGTDLWSTNALLGSSSHYFLLIPSTQYTKTQTDYVLSIGGLHQAGLVAGKPNLDAYAPNDAIWGIFGLTPPTAAPTPPTVDCSTPGCTPQQQTIYDTYQTDLTQWQTDNTSSYWALETLIQEYNVDFDTRKLSAETLHQYTDTQYTTEVISSNPGQILAAGNITINGKLTNDNSRVMAGGTITADASSINIATKGTDTTIREGAQWATIREASGRTWFTILPVNYAPYAISSTQTDLGVAKYEQNAYTGSGNSGAGIIQIPGMSGIISTMPPNITLPGNSLYQINPGTGKNYLIETDPRFTNYGTWLSSDFMLGQLGFDPARIQKRLGDGFYEQQLIREQIGNLTGFRFLAGYQNDEETYLALMQAGVTFAQELGIELGEELTPQQLSQLNTNIVWLVSKNITLADGSVENVLVPQVYLKDAASQINTAGALMSGQNVVIGGTVLADVNLTNQGDFLNIATVAAQDKLIITGRNINNELGQLHGNDTYLQASQDITNTGGIISADNSITIVAGRDFALQNTTFESQTANHTVKDISNIGTIYLSGKDSQGNPAQDGQILIQAGRDITSTGGLILNAADTTETSDANTTLVAGRNIELQSQESQRSETFTYDAINQYTKQNTNQLGAQIRSNSDINLIAGEQINITGSEIESGSGDLTLSAKEVHISAAQASSTGSGSAYTQHKGRLSKKSNHVMTSDAQTDLVGSSLGGKNITIITSGDQTYTASSVVADQNINLISQQGNITVTSGETQYDGMSYSKTKRSGLLTGHNQIGLNFGKEQNTQNEITTETKAIGSTIGSLQGNINISAQKGAYTQTGSDLLALNGDINVVAQDITIQDAREASNRLKVQEYKKSGVTIGISSPLIAAALQAKQMKDASKRTGSGRMDALAAGAAALNIFNAVDGAGIAGNPADAASVSISLTLGTQKSKNQSTEASSTSKSSNLAAGGNLNLIAVGNSNSSTGNGSKNSGNILIQGSQIKANQDILLLANNQIDIKASDNTEANLSQNKSSSGSLSVGYKFGGGWYASVAGSKGKGKGQGIQQTWNASTVEAGNTLTVITGGDLNLIGSQLIGDTVKADIGGNLTIQTLQDLELSQSKQKNTSFGLSISFGGGGGGSFSQSKASSSGIYISANEYAGIMAGDGGFQINVDGHTSLIGGIISSTEQAVQNNKNTLTTGSISIQDLDNLSQYKTKGSTIGIGGGFDLKAGNGNANPPMALSGKDSGSNSSTTLGGISNAQITITNEEEQQRRTGQTAQEAIDAINTDIRTGQSTGGIQKNWDNTDKMVDEMMANLEIAEAFTQAAGDFVSNRAAEIEKLRKDAENETDPIKKAALEKQLKEKEDFWGMGGNGRLAITAITAAIGGNVSGSTADMVQATAVNVIQGLGAEKIKGLITSMEKDDTPEGEAARAALQGILACTTAAGKGADCGSAALGASGSVALNYLANSIGKDSKDLTAQEKEDRLNLINTILTGTVDALGGDAAAASAASKIELENNGLFAGGAGDIVRFVEECRSNNYQCSLQEVKDVAEKGKAFYAEKFEEFCVNGDLAKCQHLLRGLETETDFYALSLSLGGRWKDAPDHEAYRELVLNLIIEQETDINNIKMLIDYRKQNGIYTEQDIKSAQTAELWREVGPALVGMAAPGKNIISSIGKGKTPSGSESSVNKPNAGVDGNSNNLGGQNNSSSLTVDFNKHNTQLGVLNSKKTAISGAHNKDVFSETVEITKAKVLFTTTDKKYPGLIEYHYQLPAVDGRGNSIGYKAVQTKTTYDPKVLSDAKITEMSNRAGQQAESYFKANPNNREYSVQVDGYWFRVTTDSKTKAINNVFITMPPRSIP